MKDFFDTYSDEQLSGLIEKYPWFAGARANLAKRATVSKWSNKEDVLAKAAISIPNRVVLFDYIYNIDRTVSGDLKSNNKDIGESLNEEIEIQSDLVLESQTIDDSSEVKDKEESFDLLDAVEKIERKRQNKPSASTIGKKAEDASKGIDLGAGAIEKDSQAIGNEVEEDKQEQKEESQFSKEDSIPSEIIESDEELAKEKIKLELDHLPEASALDVSPSADSAADALLRWINGDKLDEAENDEALKKSIASKAQKDKEPIELAPNSGIEFSIEDSAIQETKPPEVKTTDLKPAEVIPTEVKREETEAELKQPEVKEPKATKVEVKKVEEKKPVEKPIEKKKASKKEKVKPEVKAKATKAAPTEAASFGSWLSKLSKKEPVQEPEQESAPKELDTSTLQPGAESKSKPKQVRSKEIDDIIEPLTSFDLFHDSEMGELPNYQDLQTLDSGRAGLGEGKERIEDQAERSNALDPKFATETLAHIMVKQEKYPEAIKIFEALKLKNPEKSAFFASQIEKISRK